MDAMRLARKYEMCIRDRYYPRPILAVTDFRYSQLPWLDGR